LKTFKGPIWSESDMSLRYGIECPDQVVKQSESGIRGKAK